MIRFVAFTMTSALAVVSLAIPTRAAEELPIVWEVTEGLSAPESVYYDADTGLLFLSQIGKGGGAGVDGDGFLSKLSVDGKMIEQKWVTGLNSPKGIRVHDGTLWVSDITQLVGVEIATGKIIARVDVPDATFLNDVTCGPDGSVYVTDMRASRVMRHRDGKTEVFAEGPELEHPNGILFHEGHLILGGWAAKVDENFKTLTPGRLLSLDVTSKEITPITPEPTGNLDGIEIDGRGGYFVTDWFAGKVLHISGSGEVTTLMTLAQGTADQAVLLDSGLLILPRMKENRLTAYDIRSRLK